MKRVEIVVLNWNGWRDTLECLESLMRISYPNFGVIVVDNGSTDGSQEHIESRFPAIKVLQTGANLGFGGGCNFGIRQAIKQDADYVWLINSDATVDVNALSELVCTAETQPSVGAVGSVVYEMNKPEQIQMWGGGRIKLLWGLSRHQLKSGELDYVCGASMLLRCQALEAIGLFDEHMFFMYWEDSDLSFRLKKSGWQLYVAEKSRVWHKLSASLGRGSNQLDVYFTRSGVRFFRRYSSTPKISVLMLVARMVIKRLTTGEFNRIKSVLQGYFAA